jgi:hypothetical protein
LHLNKEAPSSWKTYLPPQVSSWVQLEKTGKINSEKIIIGVDLAEKKDTKVDFVLELRVFLCGEGTCTMAEKKVGIYIEFEEGPSAEEEKEIKI